MASTVNSAQVSGGVTASLTGGAAPAITASTPSQSLLNNFTIGTAAGNVNLVYSSALTVTTGTPLVLDLTALLDPLGGTVNFVHVCAVMITNGSVTAGQDFTVGGGTTPVFAALPLLQANGGNLQLINANPGWATSGANNLKFTVAAGTAVPFTLTILGRTT